MTAGSGTGRGLRPYTGLTGLDLRARDGVAGEVVDLLFEDTGFAVRWLVIDRGGLLPGRKVLLPPGTVENLDLAGRALAADLTRDEVAGAPSLSADEPVSRRHEKAVFGHYRWLPYWSTGGAATGLATPDPVPPAATGVPDVDPATPAAPLAGGEEEGDPSLRSLGEVRGDHIHARDGFIGHVSDALVDLDDFVVRYLVVDTRNFLPGRQVLISPDWVSSFGWADKEVRVDVTREEVKAAPEFTPDMTVTRDFEHMMHRHYGRTPYFL